MDLAGKIAVVTGGTRGIGRAVVERLAAAGARVTFTYRDNADLAATVVEAAPGSTAVRADQADLRSLDAVFGAVEADGLDILVNNAGVAPTGPIAALTAAEFDRALTVNTKFPLFAIQRAATLMRDGGRIVNVSTVNTVLPEAGTALYAASKGALEQITKVAARELGGRGITVNTVSPGATDTDLLRGANPAEALAGLPAVTALQRLGEPADVAAVIAFLCGPESGWVTGQNVQASGGLVV